MTERRSDSDRNGRRGGIIYPGERETRETHELIGSYHITDVTVGCRIRVSLKNTFVVEQLFDITIVATLRRVVSDGTRDTRIYGPKEHPCGSDSESECGA